MVEIADSVRMSGQHEALQVWQLGWLAKRYGITRVFDVFSRCLRGYNCELFHGLNLIKLLRTEA